MIFNNAFEELNHNENQQTEVHNDDADDAVNVKRTSKASRNFAKPVSYKDITEAVQKAVQSIEGTERDNTVKYCANVFHCLQGFFQDSGQGGSK